MEWLKLYARYPDDPAVAAVGEAGEVLFLRSLAYCADKDTDGFVPDYQLARFGLKAAVKRAASLVREGLWTRVDGGWEVTNWHALQAEVYSMGAKRTAERLRKEATRRKVVRGQSADSPPDEPPSVRGQSHGQEPGQSEDCPPETLSICTTTGSSTDEKEIEIEIPTSSARTGSLSADIAVIDPEHTTAQTMIREWLDHVPKRPPKRVVGQVAQALKAMLAEGIDPDDVRRGLAAWVDKSLHPSTLPSVVNEVMNGRPAGWKPSTTQQRMAQALAVAETFE